MRRAPASSALTESVAVEWAPLDIRVNCIAPGAIVSEGWAVYPRTSRGATRRQARCAAPAAPGRSPRLRCSSAARAGQFITGQTLHVNGGSNLWGETWTAGKPDVVRRGIAGVAGTVERGQT